MKKITLLTAFLISFVGFSQTNKQIIQTYLDNNRASLKLTSQDVSDWVIANEVTGSGTKITSCYVAQRFQGIEIFNAQSNVSVKDGKVLNLGNNFQSNIAQKANATTPTLSVFEAVAKAYVKLGMTAPAAFTVAETINDKSFKLSDGLQDDLIVAKLAFQTTANDKLQLAWGFQLYSADGKHYWDIKIDAVNGSVLDKKDLTVNCSFGDHKNQEVNNRFSFQSALNSKSSSMLTAAAGTYRVIPYNYQDPNHHTFDLITTSGNALASPNGWHDANNIGGTTGTLKYTYTRGNNILTQEDADGNNGTGIRAQGGASLTFDFPYGGQTSLPTSYTSAASTNLFYMGNVVHDIWYQYGFNEAAANYQQNNMSRGGVVTAAGDPVQGDSQDGYAQTTPTLDNANFAPTNDGTKPKVQMYMWTAGAPPTNYLTVNSPATIAGGYVATTNVFDTTDRIPVPAAPSPIVADLVLYNNNPTPPGYHSACQVATNALDLSGKIALIQRGGCFFSLKVKNAQDAGAIAAIVMDSIPMNPQRLSMSSTGVLGITIPAVFITKEIGDALIAEMANGAVNVKLEVPAGLYLYADGDFDNGIIAHELGHGISNRLIGAGQTGCMTNAEQMGEGWSDWFGLILQIKPGETGAEPRGIGTYAVNETVDGGGIRTYPYSTDMSIDPQTFIDSNVAEVHALGEAWCGMLWDLTWAYIGKYGFDADIYNGIGGNNKVMRLVADALKLGVCNQTTYVSSRDALIAADQATTGGHDYCLITDVFARRGMGLNASSGLSTDALDQVEDFTPFPAGPNCTFLATDYFQTKDMIRVYPNPTNGQLNIRINQFVGKVNLQVVDINGRIVYSANNSDFNVEKSINLSQLQKGMYILKVSNENLNFSEKIMIK